MQVWFARLRNRFLQFTCLLLVVLQNLLSVSEKLWLVVKKLMPVKGKLMIASEKPLTVL